MTRLVPFLCRFAAKSTHPENLLDAERYDVPSESLPDGHVAATFSTLTKAEVDPTGDEQTDR